MSSTDLNLEHSCGNLHIYSAFNKLNRTRLLLLFATADCIATRVFVYVEKMIFCSFPSVLLQVDLATMMACSLGISSVLASSA